jgi:acyl carrier protein
MEDVLMDFLLQYFMADEIDKDVKIFETGYVDSLFLMQLVSFLETKMNIHFESDDMNMENFSTINKIMQFIEKKQNIK